MVEANNHQLWPPEGLSFYQLARLVSVATPPSEEEWEYTEAFSYSAQKVEINFASIFLKVLEN